MKTPLASALVLLLCACGTTVQTATQADETVNIGYGTVNRKDLTTSVSSLKGDEHTVPYKTIYEMIAGRCAGVEVRGESIVIRGINSVNSPTEPLYVVNGITTYDISFIPPAEVESITVLKDAASCAIYGSQGANGVILIELKKQ